jgi:hypothetical protein
MLLAAIRQHDGDYAPKLDRRTPKAAAMRTATSVFQQQCSLRHGTNERLAARCGAQEREDMTMNTQTIKRALVIAIAGTIGLAAVTPSWSAPVLSSTTAVKAAAPSAVSDVRYRYRNRGYSRNTGAAVAVGVLGVAGALAARSAYQHNSYGYPGYDQQGYAPGYYQRGYGGPYDGYARGPANYGNYPTNYGNYSNY